MKSCFSSAILTKHESVFTHYNRSIILNNFISKSLCLLAAVLMGALVNVASASVGVGLADPPAVTFQVSSELSSVNLISDALNHQSIDETTSDAGGVMSDTRYKSVMAVVRYDIELMTTANTNSSAVMLDRIVDKRLSFAVPIAIQAGA